MEFQHHGITPPLSLAEPSQRELAMSRSLEALIQGRGLYEDTSVSNSRDIISKIEDLVRIWLAMAVPSQESPNTPNFMVMMFGGRGYGVASKDGDIDIVLILPKVIRREEFFSSFPSVLRKQQVISQIKVISEAYVPIINFCYEETQVDMCLSNLRHEKLPEDIDLLDDDTIRGMDALSARSLTGVRENYTLVSLVPDRDTFCSCLKVIKHWAKRRGIYHYSLGFLGGIAWAILVARTQQLYPNAAVSTLVQKFFTIFLEWQWPTPVLLRPIQENRLELQQWNPQVSTADGRHPMAIITPAYPEHNAAFTATPSTISVIQQELALGKELSDNAMENGNWEALFQPINIGNMYKHYLILIAKAPEEQLLDWASLVESRIRIFVRSLEKLSSVSLVHPYPFPHKVAADVANNTFPSTRWLLGLVLAAVPGTKLSIASDIKAFRETVEELAVERRIFKRGMTIDVTHVKRKSLSEHFSLNQ